MRRSLQKLAETAEKCPFHPEKSITPRGFSEIPGPRDLPFFGSLENLKFALKNDRKTIENYNEHLGEMYKKYGKIVKENLGFGRKYVVHLFDPADAQTVFAADGKTPFIVPLQETTQKYREMKGMNPGLGNLNGPEWYRLRSSVQHAMMTPQAVQTYLPFSQKVSDDLVCHVTDEQKRHGHVDMQKVAGRWSLESAGQILFEKSLGSLGERREWADGLIELNKRIFQLSARMRLGLPIFRLFSTPSWRKMVELEDMFYAEVDRLMDDALDKLIVTDKGNQNLRFASYLINRKELNRRDVKVILLSMFSDGLSTTAPMLIYNLFNIATHPEAQEQIRKEIREDNSKLPYLRACIKETFRMFPIGTEVSRITQKDLVLSGFEVPAGTAVDINTNVLMRNAYLFSDDPHVFKPSRWLEKDKSTHHPFAFLPFGFGPRMCAGRRFAEQDLLTTLTKLCGKFRIRHFGDPISQIYETLLLPRGSSNTGGQCGTGTKHDDYLRKVTSESDQRLLKSSESVMNSLAIILLATILACCLAYTPEDLQWRAPEGIRVKRGWGGGYPYGGGYGGGYPGGYGGGYPGGYGGYGGGFPQYGGGSYGSSSWGSYSSSRSGGYSNYNSGFFGK